MNYRKDIQLNILEFNEHESEVQTKWRFSALLELPWKPRLAAAGGTRHVFDQVWPLVRQQQEWQSSIYSKKRLTKM